MFSGFEFHVCDVVCLGQAASDVYAPVSGEVVETNTDLADEANLSKVSCLLLIKLAWCICKFFEGPSPPVFRRAPHLVL